MTFCIVYCTPYSSYFKVTELGRQVEETFGLLKLTRATEVDPASLGIQPKTLWHSAASISMRITGALTSSPFQVAKYGQRLTGTHQHIPLHQTSSEQYKIAHKLLTAYTVYYNVFGLVINYRSRMSTIIA